MAMKINLYKNKMTSFLVFVASDDAILLHMTIYWFYELCDISQYHPITRRHWWKRHCLSDLQATVWDCMMKVTTTLLNNRFVDQDTIRTRVK